MKHFCRILMGILFPLWISSVCATENNTTILVLFHSDHGGTFELAEELGRGIEREGKATAVIKQVKSAANPKFKDIPVASVEELPAYDGIAFGSPVYFGNISTPMSEFLSNTVELWANHQLEGMPATVFMSGGSGAGNELAIQAFWNSLAVHGMVLVPNGIRGTENIDKSIPQGGSVLGTSSLASVKIVERPSPDERYLANLQGANFAKVAAALKGTFQKKARDTDEAPSIEAVLKEKGIVLPKPPQPAGNYVPYRRSGNLIFINQIALKNGTVHHPGKLGMDITEEQAKEATVTAMMNVLAVLKEAVGGDLQRVRRSVQLTGIFNAVETYTQHASIMNTASDLTAEIFGEKGRHTRATFGASSLPLNSVIEIQAVFEVAL